MDDMPARQPPRVIRAALVPQNLVLIQWRPSGATSDAQITGTVQAITEDMVRLLPLQGAYRRGGRISLDRIHSVVVKREGAIAREARDRAAAHLQLAALHLATGNDTKANGHLRLAIDFFPAIAPTQKD